MFAATAALALALSQTASPSPTASAQVTFAFEDAQLDPTTYNLLIREDGSGHYQSTPGPAPAPNAIDGVAGAPVARDIKVRDPLLSAFFQTARSHRLFATACDAPGSHVAFTGKKTVSYTGPDGHGECTFNWSRDQQLNQLAADLMAIAYTIDEGRRLATEHVHSRLSLDAELEALQDALKDRRALEIENISSELESIANDEAVMNRARNRARALLSGSAKH
jgi:hypothetical protein